jgi:hypothetical protein
MMSLSACSPSAPTAQDVAALNQFVAQLDGQGSGSPPVAGEMKTLAIVSVGSYQKLLGNVSFLGSLIGMAQADKIVEAQVLQIIQDKGLATLDKAKPWGVVLQSDGMGFAPLAVLPVAKPDALFAVLEANGIRTLPAADGIREMLLPNGMSVFAKSDGGWTMLGDSPQAFAKVPATLHADLAALAGEYDIAARIIVKNVPPDAQQMIMGWVRGGADAVLQPKPGESEEAVAARRQTAEKQLHEVEKTIKELDRVTIGMKIDPAEKRGMFDMSVEAIAGSSLAKTMQSHGEPRTNFAGFRSPDAALTFSFVDQLNDEAVQELKGKRGEIVSQLNAAIDNDENLPPAMRDAAKSAAGDILDAFLTTVESGKVDGGGALRVSPESLTFVAGTRIKDTAKFVSGLKKLEAAVKQQSPGAPGFTWDAAEHAGVKFHTLSLPLPPDANEAARKMFGNELPVAFGVGTETAYIAIGRDHLAAVNKAIDASRAEPNKLVPQFEVNLSMKQLIALAATHTEDPQAQMSLQMMSSSLQTDQAGRDHVRMIGETFANGQRVRFEAEESAMKAVGQAMFMAVMRGMAQ